MSTRRRERAIDEARRWASVVLIVLLAVVSYQVYTLGGSVTRIERSSSHTEAAASELVGFVHEIQAQQPSPSTGGQSQVVAMLVDLLCASSDPVRVQACAALKPGGGG